MDHGVKLFSVVDCLFSRIVESQRDESKEYAPNRLEWNF